IEGKDFPSTILSLQSENKIKKWYLIGAFGQGGASTLAFCDYAIIFSRSKESPNKIAFTMIRVLKLDASYKDDCFSYLGYADDADNFNIFETVHVGPLDIYPEARASKIPAMKQGTLVRHVNYRLTNLDKTLSSSPGN